MNSGFRRVVNEIFALLGCYTALVLSYGRFFDGLTLEDGADRLSRNVGTNYQSTLRNAPEQPRYQR